MNGFLLRKGTISPDLRKIRDFFRIDKQGNTSCRVELMLSNKALRNWKIFLNALLKRLRKLTIKTKRQWQLKFLSFVNINDLQLMSDFNKNRLK